jgi:quinol monooxygenase YgiN
MLILLPVEQMEVNMHIVLVHIHVKPEFIEQFKAASLKNASHSIKEAGIARFDVIQQQDDATRFILVEVYRDAKASAAHKETSHYKEWRDRVELMMAEPRVGVKYTNFFPNDPDWG